VGKGEETKHQVEFYKVNWETIKDGVQNKMYIGGEVTEQQKHGVIICTLTSRGPTKPKDLRPITLLDNDYKPMARVIANRLRPMMPEHL